MKTQSNNVKKSKSLKKKFNFNLCDNNFFYKKQKNKNNLH